MKDALSVLGDSARCRVPVRRAVPSAVGHLCFNDVEHVSSIASQPVGYPDVHSGARQPAGPVVYCLESDIERLKVALHVFQLDEA